MKPERFPGESTVNHGTPRDLSGLTEQKAISPRLQPGQTVGRYVIERILGQGGMGTVLLAKDTSLGRQVALKIPIFKDGVNSEAVDRFYREVRFAATLHHPNICPVFDVGELDGSPFMSMAFIRGRSLAELISPDSRIPERWTASVVRVLAEALQTAHQHGIIHRDVKPSNVMIDTHNKPILMDFGLARSADPSTASLTQEGVLLGSPAYMSPEQARQEQLGPATDIYSLGVLLYEMLCGRKPFSGPGYEVLVQIAMEAPPRPTSLRQDISPVLESACLRAMAKKPEHRFGSMSEFAADLKRFVDNKPYVVPRHVPSYSESEAATEKMSVPQESVWESLEDPPPPPEPKKSPSEKAPGSRIWLVTIAIIGVLLATGATLWMIVPPTGEKEELPSTSQGTPGDGSKGRGPKEDPLFAEPVEVGSFADALRAHPIEGEGPLQVIVMAGQTNMNGPAPVRELAGLLDQKPDLAPWLRDPDGKWKERRDVWVHNRDRFGPLTVGYGDRPGDFGPELAFGHVVGDHFEQPVLLLKYCPGNLALSDEGLPPRSPGPVGPYYRVLVAHVRQVIREVKHALPAYRKPGQIQISFVWFQGWNDWFRPYRDQYQSSLANLIRDLREDWETPQMPCVIGEFGAHGLKPVPEAVIIREAQAAVAKLPEFTGTVIFIPTAQLVTTEKQEVMFLYYRDPETFLRIGEALGRGLVELETGQ